MKYYKLINRKTREDYYQTEDQLQKIKDAGLIKLYTVTEIQEEELPEKYYTTARDIQINVEPIRSMKPSAKAENVERSTEVKKPARKEKKD